MRQYILFILFRVSVLLIAMESEEATSTVDPMEVVADDVVVVEGGGGENKENEVEEEKEKVNCHTQHTLYEFVWGKLTKNMVKNVE